MVDTNRRSVASFALVCVYVALQRSAKAQLKQEWHCASVGAKDGQQGKVLSDDLQVAAAYLLALCLLYVLVLCLTWMYVCALVVYVSMCSCVLVYVSICACDTRTPTK